MLGPVKRHGLDREWLTASPLMSKMPNVYLNLYKMAIRRPPPSPLIPFHSSESLIRRYD
jgi:hypothetical protein